MSNVAFRRVACSFAFLAATFATLSLARAQAPEGGNAAEIRNVILMIGDGMAPAQVQLAADFAGKPLAMTSLPVKGMSQTAAANRAVTDSAAAGTALACGQKTDSGMLGQLPDGTPLESIAKLFRDAGKRVGILSSVPLNHATPAAFYANVASRNSYYEIGLQALASKFNVLGGSGFSDADGKNHKPTPEKSLWTLTEESDYKLVRSPEALKAITADSPHVVIIPQRLYAEAGVPYAREFDPEQHITLAQMTAKALELLDNPAGFFLMVEGGAIDWAGHANDAVANIAEMLAFDEAVAVAKAFAEANPGTLLVVTSDHETGGLSMQEGYTAETARAVLSRQVIRSGDLADKLRAHLAAARDAGAEDSGWGGAQLIFAAALGLDTSDYASLADSYKAFAEADDKEQRKAQDKLLRDAAKIRDTAAGIAWSTGGHTATDVPVYAFGPNAERFEGTQDNTAIMAHCIQ